jgi:hypothetical protein
MEGLGAILEERTWAFDSNQLGTSRRATLEGHGRLATAEMASNKTKELLVRLTVDRRRLELSEPGAALDLLEEADSRVRLDLDRDDGARSFWSAHMGPNVRHERWTKGREAAFGTSARWRG